jgi:LAO/AO transport system kinase
MMMMMTRRKRRRGDLGGVSLHTNDAITLCEAAGYDFVMVETVGIGQSEVSVSQVVDMLILIVAPGGGDGLQGVKKGIMEVADLLIVNKADGDLLPVARNTVADYIGATHFLRSRVEGWSTPPVLLASAKTGDGFNEVWETICKYRQIMTDNNELGRRKAKQARYWMWKHVQDLITSRVKSDDRIGAMAEEVENALDQGILSPRVAASNILQFLHLSLNGGNSKD